MQFPFAANEHNLPDVDDEDVAVVVVTFVGCTKGQLKPLVHVPFTANEHMFPLICCFEDLNTCLNFLKDLNS